ncbi:MAG: hypothetical protein H0V63_10275 [Burkholderiaceae bacterium]|nr:hypothetical protein [Burkholderiaceae bacterium]
MPENDPLTQYGAPLAGVLIAVVLSIPVAAMVAGQIGDAYQTRALVYAGFVLWLLIGAVIMFMLAHRGEGDRASGRLSISRVLLWAASIWLWPIFLLFNRHRANANRDV